jgi:VanZ family protein
MKKVTVMSTFLTKYLPALVWAGLVAVALLMTGDSIDDVGLWFEIPDWLRSLADQLRPWAERLLPWAERWADKVVHFGLFLVLAILVRRCFQDPRDESGPAIKTLAATLVYIVILEAAQIRIPGRGWETLDVVAGIAGVLLGVLMIQVYRTRRAVQKPLAEPGSGR